MSGLVFEKSPAGKSEERDRKSVSETERGTRLEQSYCRYFEISKSSGKLNLCGFDISARAARDTNMNTDEVTNQTQ